MTAKAAFGILRGSCRNFLERYAAKHGYALGNVNDECWLAPLASHGHRRKIRTVGFDKNSIERSPCRDVVNGFGVGKRNNARKRSIEVEVESVFCKCAIFAEAMDDTAYVARAFAFEHTERVGSRLARMNDNGLSEFPRKPYLANEGRALNCARRVVVMVIKANFADGNNERLTRKLRELGKDFVIQNPRLMRMNANYRANAFRQSLGKRDGMTSRREIVPNANGNKALHPGKNGPRDHLVRT